MSTIEVVGIDRASRLGDVAARIAHRIAAELDVPLPSDAVVDVHARVGVPYTQRHRIHLFKGPSGHVELFQLPHELVHVVAGLSPRRFLSEGLAVDVAARLTRRSCWPSFRLTPDEWMAFLLSKGQRPPSLESLVATMEAMSLARSEANGPAGIREASIAYVVAGSFVHFLFQRLERTAFWRGYHSGAFWQGRAELRRLESEWLRALPRVLDPDARVRLTASLSDSRRQRAAARGAADAANSRR